MNSKDKIAETLLNSFNKMLDEQTQKQKSDAQLAAAKKAKLARTRAAAKQATDAANKKWAAHARNDPGDWLYR